LPHGWVSGGVCGDAVTRGCLVASGRRRRRTVNKELSPPLHGTTEVIPAYAHVRRWRYGIAIRCRVRYEITKCERRRSGRPFCMRYACVCGSGGVGVGVAAGAAARAPSEVEAPKAAIRIGAAMFLLTPPHRPPSAPQGPFGCVAGKKIHRAASGPRFFEAGAALPWVCGIPAMAQQRGNTGRMRFLFLCQLLLWFCIGMRRAGSIF
jgi:hypothetical protein